MTIQIQHYRLVKKLIKPGYRLYEEISPKKLELIHAAFGIAGEAGEILDTIKKHCIYNQSLDRDNLLEELGDLEFFTENLRQLLLVTREYILLENIRKLNKRYPNGYSNEAAKERLDKNMHKMQKKKTNYSKS